MPVDRHLFSQVSRLGQILSKGNDFEIKASADDLLLFLNRLQDFVRHHPKSTISLSSFIDIIYGLESAPEAALMDKTVRARLKDLFVKVAGL